MSSLITAPTQVGDTLLQPAVPASANETALELYNPDTVGQGLEFYQRFADKGNAQTALATVARQELPGMLAKPDSIIDYGNDILDEVVAATKAIMEFTKGVKLPDDDEAALRQLKVQLGKVGQYDMSVAENVEKYRKMKEGLKKLLGKGKAKAWFAAFQADRMSLEKLTDEMAGDLITRSKHRAVAANQTRGLFQANRDSLALMEERIAVLEQARLMVQEERNKLPATVPPSDPRADQITGMEMVLRMLDVKITGLASRWYTGVGLDPMLRALQEQQIMMAMKLRDSGTTGMEKIRLILAQYAMSLDLQNDADTITAFEDFDNAMTQKMFKQTRSTIGQVAGITSRASVTEETITTIANEVTGMLTDVQGAYAQARQDHAAKMQAMMTGIQIMESAQTAPVDQSMVRSVVGEANKSRSLLG